LDEFPDVQTNRKRRRKMKKMDFGIGDKMLLIFLSILISLLCGLYCKIAFTKSIFSVEVYLVARVLVTVGIPVCNNYLYNLKHLIFSLANIDQWNFWYLYSNAPPISRVHDYPLHAMRREMTIPWLLKILSFSTI
jgi:hypothetical protein